MRRVSDERGDIILSGLLRTVVAVLAFGAILFDGGAVLINRTQLDEAARTAARAGAVTWAREHSRSAVDLAVDRHLAREQRMELEAVAVQGSEVSVTLSRPAQVLLLDRIGLLRHHAQARATSVSAAPSPG